MGRNARRRRKKATGDEPSTEAIRGAEAPHKGRTRRGERGPRRSRPQRGERRAGSGARELPTQRESLNCRGQTPWLSLRFHDKPEIDDMPHPHGGNNCTANRNVAHHGKAHSQKHGNGHKDSELRPQRHGPLGHIALKHHLVDLRAFKPAVQTIGAARKAESGHQDERRRRQNRQHCARHPQSEKEKTSCRPQAVAQA